ncbi:NnrS family protein [Permianibacter sp. IMCC34836]|uniref:NnrS family protein n=1 Tax=Permianibacter fluminis TaxID=2738515 RepID=UPI001553326D|nr:NnrS family protein [Permianibacter fluminis]NQD37898.1 NnrS family protein [Permianibacter fluminis]
MFIPLASIHDASAPRYPAWLALGFRPFYLLAAAWMIVALPVWLVMFGHGAVMASHLQGVNWHAHEMVFGFTPAVITGFLFTAVKNWTGQPTPRGLPLLVIAGVWLLARVLLLTSLSKLGMIFDIAFFVLAAVGIAIPLLRSGNRRNVFFIGLLLLLGSLSALHHYAALSSAPVLRTDQVVQLALTIIAVIITVITGRVIPMFTSNAVAGAPVKKLPHLEQAAVVSVIAVGLVVALFSSSPVTPLVCIVAAAIHLWRWWLWAPHWTLGKPILWILHGSYLWLPISFLLRASASWQPMNALLATHALTLGLITGLCLGMMTRTARGHTGRALQVGRAETTAYVLIVLAAVLRVLLPLLLPSHYRLWASLSGLLAIAAFAIYFAIYLPWLCQPRADGRPD